MGNAGRRVHVAFGGPDRFIQEVGDLGEHRPRCLRGIQSGTSIVKMNIIESVFTCYNGWGKLGMGALHWNQPEFVQLALARVTAEQWAATSHREIWPRDHCRKCFLRNLILSDMPRHSFPNKQTKIDDYVVWPEPRLSKVSPVRDIM